VVARIYGHIVSLNLPTTLLDLSTGGFLMQSPVAFPVGAVEEFRFTTEQVDIVLRARVVRILTASRSDGVAYMTGLKFIDLDEEQRDTIARLVSL
jgi:c-di-GMP-binding flagellar brake protein YcgR